jgi:hypothetical protein
MPVRSSIKVSMNKLSTADRVRVVAALVEGCSIRATVRMTGVAKNTIAKLLADLGEACQTYHDLNVRNLSSKRIQCDEIWAFCKSKEKNVAPENKGILGFGDIWTFTGIDADTKLMVAWRVGFREASWANNFMRDIADRLTNRVQLTTDGHGVYLRAVYNAFGTDIDYMQLVKIYGPDRSSPIRYSPPQFVSAEATEICGMPDRAHCSTSFVERANLTMRMGMRRFTRLTNGFSKKAANHAHMTAIFFTHYNFCRIHMTLKTTPARAAGLADRVWAVEELIALMN